MRQLAVERDGRAGLGGLEPARRLVLLARRGRGRTRGGAARGARRGLARGLARGGRRRRGRKRRGRRRRLCAVGRGRRRRPPRARGDERPDAAGRDLDFSALDVDGDGVARSRHDEVRPDDAHLDAARLDQEGRPLAARRDVALDAAPVERHDDAARVVAREPHGRRRADVDRRLAELDARPDGGRLDARRALPAALRDAALRDQRAPREAARDRRQRAREDEERRGGPPPRRRRVRPQGPRGLRAGAPVGAGRGRLEDGALDARPPDLAEGLDLQLATEDGGTLHRSAAGAAPPFMRLAMRGSRLAARRSARHARQTRTFVATTLASMLSATCLMGRPSTTCKVNATRCDVGRRFERSVEVGRGLARHGALVGAGLLAERLGDD